MVAAREVSRDAAREVLTMLVEDGGDPREIVEREGLGAISGEEDGQLAEIVDAAIAVGSRRRRAGARGERAGDRARWSAT